MKRAVLLLLFLTCSAAAQVGTWRTHSDMQNIRDIAAGQDALWAATGGGVFQQLSDGTFIRYTNIDGLSAIDYTAIAVADEGLVIAGSSSGMINVYTPETGWFEESGIARAADLPARGITSVLMHDGLAYIGTEFGLAVYDPVRREFGDSYQKFSTLRTQLPVSSVLIEGGRLWVGTSEGIAFGELDNINLKDPSSWTAFTGTSSEQFGAIEALALLDGKVVFSTAKKMFRYDSGTWTEFRSLLPGGEVMALRENGSHVLLVTSLGVFRIAADAQVEQIGSKVNADPYIKGTVMRDVDVAQDGTLIAASNRGVAVYVEGEEWDFEKPNGPNSNLVRRMSVDSEGLLWAASGNAEGGSGMYAYDGSVWMNYTADTHPEIMRNSITDATGGTDGGMWFSTWGSGVFHRGINGSVEAFNTSNVSGFPGIPVDEDYAAVRAIEMDDQGNLWVLHYLGTTVLGCYTPQGQWHFLHPPGLAVDLVVVDFTIDQFGQKWVIVDDDKFRGVLLLDDNNTPGNPSDDIWTKLTATDANVLNADQRVLSVATDLLGDVWIGTDRGLRTLFNPREPDRVSKTCFNTRCNIEGQVITCITVDPVNNKWIGTREGVFVLSPDGSDIIAQYSVDNSPLLDNSIETIFVHPVTGIAYIATGVGLSSLATPYVQPVQTFDELVLAPNPFRPGIDERVMIDGLVEGSIIKILSVSGDLIAELESPGGRVGFWDGRTDDGGIAPSGVYFVVAAAPNGSQSAVAKLALIKP
ncbi:MAG: hypothetical protein C0600_00290 [Ignavibacteria bacterium]|nr:MAG: hypothetical protein C0600_00290 [Ignavibacteria bacterium]